MAHISFAALAAIDDARAQGLYNRLRAAYNPARLPGLNPAPPLEEWQGMLAICNDIHCRCTPLFCDIFCDPVMLMLM